MATRTTAEWLKLFDKSGVPTIVVNSLEDLITIRISRRPGSGRATSTRPRASCACRRFPVNFGSTPASIHRHAPRLGEHTEEVLREAGLDAATIATLTACGAAMTAEQAAGTVGEGGD